MKAIEVTGRIDEQRRLMLDAPLPVQGPSRVRVLVLIEEEEYDEQEWMIAAARNPAFDFLRDPAEDIYSPTDGKPFRDEV